MIGMNRDEAIALDKADPLANVRGEFLLPENTIYLDGNSLGALPKRTSPALERVIHHEWGDRLIRGWNDAGWWEAPQRIGDKLAPLLGANPGEVIVGDSTSVNLFKLLSGALQARPERRIILSERGNFPTDLYIAQGLIETLQQGHELVLVDHVAELDQRLDETVAAVFLTHVNYRTGDMLDLEGITDKVQQAGALMIWDLCHSVGAMPLHVTDAHVDLAIGCSYKYLNGGPGAPAFIYVRRDLQEDFHNPITGWLGHDRPFDFQTTYVPDGSARRFLSGTPGVLGLAALESSLDLWAEIDLEKVREKSVALTDLFIAQTEIRCAGFDLRLESPRESESRGSQVSLAHPQASAIMQALIAQGVIGDFRAPDLMRFGLTPLYTRYVDVVDAVDRLSMILSTELWKQEAFTRTGTVT